MQQAAIDIRPFRLRSADAMLAALPLAFAQLFERRLLALMLRSMVMTLAIVIAIGAAGWFAIERLGAAYLPGDGAARGVVALFVAVLAGWLLFRLIALAVLQFYGDEVVRAVEAKHYPAAAASARTLGWRQELAVGLRGMLRSLLWNLAALPVALVLLFTAIGPAVVFGAVNAALLGRELTEMVRLRHPDAAAVPAPVRWALGGVVVALLTVPFANLLAPFLGAAAATHIVHRRSAARA